MAESSGVAVLSGVPSARPPGNPCIACGRQVRTHRRTEVAWPSGEVTVEAVCSQHAHRYPLIEEETNG